jgi:hypothetical protein
MEPGQRARAHVPHPLRPYAGGSVNTAPATARSLAHLVDALPPDTTWATEVRERLGLPS